MGHIRQRSPGSFELRYSFGRNPKTGRPRTVTTTIKGNRRAAEKELRRLLHTIDAGEHVDPIRMTVREWLVQWLGSVRTEIAPKSYERYEDTVAGHLAPALGDLPITKLAPSHIQVAYNDWATKGRRDGKAGGLSPRSRRHIHRILRSALARAVEQQVLARQPGRRFEEAPAQGRALWNVHSDNGAVCAVVGGYQTHPRLLAGIDRACDRNAARRSARIAPEERRS